MATASSSEVVFEEDLDEILELLDEDFFINDDIASTYLEDVAVEAEAEIKTFKCSQCDKVCKSKQGLSRHTNSKHNNTSSSVESKAELKLHPAKFWKFVSESALKLSKDI